MGEIDRFEDFVAWRKARELTKQIYRITRHSGFAKDLGLVGQMRRASASIMSNIAEGFERHGRAEFHQFLSTAKASCAEVRSHLYVALDAGYINENTFRELQSLAVEVARVIGGLRATVQNQRDSQRHK